MVLAVLATQNHCAYCATSPDGETVLKWCPCRQISYCSNECSKAAWEVHRLVCTRGKINNGSKTFRYGDLVRIQGLQSTRGQSMNGCLAEVQSFDRAANRYAVLLCDQEQPLHITGALVKKESLSMAMCAGEGARKAAAVGRDLETSWSSTLQCNLASVPTPTEMVEEIKQGNLEMITFACSSIQSNDGRKVTARYLLEHGLARALLFQFPFPETIDQVLDPSIPPRRVPMRIHSLKLCLDSVPMDCAYQHDICEEVGENLGPLILLLASKKRRLYGASEYWCDFQHDLVIILFYVLGNSSGRAAVLKLPEEVIAALLEHVVLLLVMDPAIFLSTRSQLEDRFLAGRTRKEGELRILYSIACLLSDLDLGEKLICKFAMSKIPLGSGLRGTTFACCLFDVFVLANKAVPMPSKDFFGRVHGAAAYVLDSFLVASERSEELRTEMVELLADNQAAAKQFNELSSQQEVDAWCRRWEARDMTMDS